MAQIAFKELSHQVLRAVLVHNILGPGLLESTYEQSLVIELQRRGIPVFRQKVYPLYYKGELAGAYIADLVVDNRIILEFKSVRQLTCVMEAQLINYLRLSKVSVGYLINFCNTKVQWRRFVQTGDG
ncbi:GxxExxY protein [Marispirochaeta aestuarii]|uniref:GxxExxY protein n=1 Tax=Marispirochaeta aestuarii TaxID=1963862 RepID=UPI0029C6C2D6|nr:GxxExxY protein [Marispirochaeta aestuarii]